MTVKLYCDKCEIDITPDDAKEFHMYTVHKLDGYHIGQTKKILCNK